MNADPYSAYCSVVESKVLRGVWAQAYDHHFWSEAEPPWSQATAEDAVLVIERLAPRENTLIADFGCGSGCLGRHLVRATQARVDGIDVNPFAVRLAEERAKQSGLSERLSYRVGDLTTMDWPDAHFEGGASLDVLLMVGDKPRALREIARVLKPGARFVGTTFEFRAPSKALGTAAFDDYEGAFGEAGFVIELYEESQGWRELLEGALAALAANEAEIRREVHPLAADRTFAWVHARPGELDDSRRVRFSVRRA